MRGLRTRESNKFKKFWGLVQKKAMEKESVFFLESGDGNEFETEEMEGENLQGWIVPLSKANEFEKVWNKHEEDDEWIDFFCWVEWKQKDEDIEINFI